MSIESMIAMYGYPAVFIGCFLEGESVILVAGLLAFNGYLSYPGLAVTAAAGAFTGDSVFFYLGRKSRRLAWFRRPRWRKAVFRASRLLHRHQRLTLIGYRFIYGLRGVIPFLLGAGKFSSLRFILLSGVGVVVWTAFNLATVHCLGRLLLSHLSLLRLVQILAFLVLALVLGLVFRNRRCRLSESANAQASTEIPPS